MSKVQRDEVVIAGIGGAFPYADNMDELRDNLFNKIDMVRESTDPHWKAGAKLEIPNRVGKISKSTQFDAAFFGVHRKQCNPMDPMTRLMMERSFEAIIDAGVNPSDLRGSNMGVFMGSYISESENSWMFVDTESGFGILGHNRSMLANRVSYWLNTHGPSYAFISADTCGIQGLSMAYQAMREGRCDSALVGTANLVMHPEMSWHLCQLGLLSEDGKCKSFDASANGYARSEAVIAMFLQKSKDAKRIYATVVHSDYCFYGDRQEKYTSSLSPIPLTDLLTNFYSACGVDPKEIAYLEADGSGRKQGDQVELNVIDKVLVGNRKDVLLVGSVKSNLGHAEASSNLAAVVKVIIAMQAGMIPPNLHFETPSPLIPALVQGRMKVVTESTPWSGGLAAVNTVGVTGEYGHILLRSCNKVKPVCNDDLARLVVASSRTEEGLEKLLSQVESMPFDHEFVKLLQDVYSVNTPNYIFRGYTILNKTSGDEQKNREMQRYDGSKRPIWFVFSGMGSQWAGMGTQLMSIPIFAQTIEKCHAILKPKGVDLKNIITTTDPKIFDNILHSFVGIAAIQLGLVDVLFAMGIEPDGIIGHSVGELGCAYADGCFTLEQMILSAYSRGRASIETELIKGTMAAVGMGYHQIKELCPSGIEVACHNSSDSSTISGPSEQMEHFVANLQANGVFARSVNVANIAYHSKYIAPAAPTLLKYLKEVIPNPKLRSKRWISTSVPESKWDSPNAQYSSAEYHTNNLLGSVLFEEGSAHMPKNAIAIEIAPHGLLQAILRRSLGAECTNIPLTHRGHKKAVEFMMSAIGKLYLAGLFPKVDRLYPEVAFPVSRGTPSIAPLVSWEHSDRWHIAAEVDTIGRIPGERDLIISLNHEEDRLYSGHVIGGRILFPVSAFLKIVWQTFEQIHGSVTNKLAVVFEGVVFHKELVIPERGSVKLYILLQRGSGDFEISTEGELLVSGQIRIPEKVEDEFVKQISNERELGDKINSEEVYRELEHRGYEYSGLFKSITSVQLGRKGCLSKVQWSDNWITFIDSLVQLSMLQSAESAQNLQVPVSIQKLVINPDMNAEVHKEYEAVSTRSIQVIRCAGVEIRGLKTAPIDNLAMKEAKLNLDAFRFIPHTNSGLKSVKDFLEVSVQLAMENACTNHLIVIEVEDTQAKLTPLAPEVKDLAKLYSNIRIDVRIAQCNNGVLSSEEKPNSFLVLTSNNTIKIAASLLETQEGFLLVRVSENDTWRPENSLVVVAELRCQGQRMMLLRKASEVEDRKSAVLKLSGDEATWSKQIRSALENKEKKKCYILAEKRPREEITTFLKKAIKEFGSDKIRFVFMLDVKVPKFSLAENFFRQQLRQDLLVNVFKDGQWGSFRHLSLGKAKAGFSKPAAEYLPVKCLEGLKMHYLGINLKDSTVENENENPYLETLGMCDLGHLEFSGFSPSTHRLMGIARTGQKSAVLKPDPTLTWQVPDAWSLEEAASVPLAYAMAYYTLFLTAKIASDEKVLVHSGCSSVSQAIIRIALHHGNTVFTTVCDQKQKIYLKKKFPKLLDENIYSMDDTNFEIALLMATGGKGVQVIISSLQGPQLHSSIHCISQHGRFIQLGRSDMVKNSKFGMSMFLKSTAFYGVASDNLFHACAEWKKNLHSFMQEGIQSGTVQPLDRTVFSKQQVDQALRMLNEGNHTEKILLAVGSDKPSQTQTTTQRQQHSDVTFKFSCNPDASYLVVGGKAELCLDLAEWLVARGASKVVIAQPSQTVTSHGARRLNLLRQHHNAQVVLASAGKASSLQGASSIIQEAVVLGPLAGVFILPTEISKGTGLSDSCIANIDNASRKLTSINLFACLLYDGGAALCDTRRQAGLPALAVHWPDNLGVDGNVWRALNVLDGILAKASDSVVYVSESIQHVGNESNSTSDSDKLTLFLPSSLDDLVELGADLLDQDENLLLELSSLSPGLGLVREIPPLFIVPGLQASCENDELIKPLARELMYPILCVQLTKLHTSISNMAVTMAKHVRAAQNVGPYNLLGASWGGALALEIARELESQGERTQVFLLDGAPETTQRIAQQLGTGDHLQVNLISKLLQISSKKITQELLTLPNWESRLKCALSKMPPSVNKEHVSAALTATYERINALHNFKPSESLVQGIVHLIRPSEGGIEHDNCGLDKFFKQTVNITLVEGDHKKMLYSKEAASIINDNIIM